MTRNLTVLAIIALFVFQSCNNKKETVTDPKADKAAILSLMQNYENAFKNSDWDKMLTYIHPGAFDFVSKADFKKALESSFKGEGFTMKVTTLEVDSVQNTIVNKSDKYAKVFMHMSADMELASAPDSSVCAAMHSDPSIQYTDCRVEGNHVYFGLKDNLYAIYLGKDGKWYVLSKGDAESKKMVEKLIPAEVRQKLGE